MNANSKVIASGVAAGLLAFPPWKEMQTAPRLVAFGVAAGLLRFPQPTQEIQDRSAQQRAWSRWAATHKGARRNYFRAYRQRTKAEYVNYQRRYWTSRKAELLAKRRALRERRSAKRQRQAEYMRMWRRTHNERN